MNKINKNEKWLILCDLDGTLLKDSSTAEISQVDKDAIKRLTDAGHVFAIATGRPWSSSKVAYESLGLDTIIANYNGAQIHNPSNYDFTQQISYMNLNDVMYILGDEKIKDAMSNLAIEGPGWVMLDHHDEDLEKIFGFNSAHKFKIGIDFHKLPLRPTGVIFDTKPGVNILELKDYLSRKYGDLAEFSSWSKGEGLTPVFDITDVGVTKSKAIALLARYYDVDIHRTVAMGDGYNDLPMMHAAEISVAVGNASKDIREQATYACKNTNKTGAVAEFIDKFLADKDNSFKKELSEIRKSKRIWKDATTKAH